MATTLPPLPYAYDALEPYISHEIMALHHRNHHQTYVNALSATLVAHGDKGLTFPLYARLPPHPLLPFSWRNTLVTCTTTRTATSNLPLSADTYRFLAHTPVHLNAIWGASLSHRQVVCTPPHGNEPILTLTTSICIYQHSYQQFTKSGALTRCTRRI
jgi:hypothetical protein